MKIRIGTLLLLALFPISLAAQVSKTGSKTVSPSLTPSISVYPQVQAEGLIDRVDKRIEKNDGKLSIGWQPVYTETPSEGNTKKFLLFTGSSNFSETGDLPVYVQLFPTSNGRSIRAEVVDAEYEILSSDELEGLTDLDKIGTEVAIATDDMISAKQHLTRLRIVPLRRNQVTGTIEKLTRFNLNESIVGVSASRSSSAAGFASSSKLAGGSWYKISVAEDGIYNITYSDLEALGMDPSSIDPRKISLYGNGGGMVPIINGEERLDDLQENAIIVTGESDGDFDSDDKIVFYGQGPHRWTEADSNSCMAFHHIKHLYSEKTFYFLKVGSGNGKRVQNQVNADTPHNTVATSFDDYGFFESDEHNLLKSGREWYGQVLDITTSQSLSFGFVNRITAEPIKLRTRVVSRSIGTPSSFQFNVNGGNEFTVTPGSVTGEYYQKFAETVISCQEIITGSSSVSIDLEFNKAVSNAQGWLDHVEVNVRRNLTYSGSEVLFRDSRSVGVGNITEFRLANTSSSVLLWDVTDPTNVKRQVVEQNGSIQTFALSTESVRQFASFNGAGYRSVELEGGVENQNLHGLSQANMIIVAHPDFVTEADRLADFHRNSEKRSLSVHVVSPEEIYNEFSSGAQDICAIRDFMRMFYERAGSNPSNMARYLLLFGDASYDYKDVLDGNTNFVPTFESYESMLPTRSYASDDYFGMLDPSEGHWTASSADALDIGVGRFPVRTLEDATGVVDKILRYEEVNAAGSSIGGQEECINGVGSAVVAPDWRNRVVMIADDEDGNMHFNQADELADTIQSRYPEYNLTKIYLDAYVQVSTPGGQRYPEVQVDLNNNIEKGALIVNYTGHGGELGWTHERVLGISDINAWSNASNLPAFVTATCEFSRYDDPSRVSAGELVLLNPNGGGIALFTTSRLVYSAPNFNLNMKFYQNLFNEQLWGDPTMGDVIRMTKVAAGSDVNNRNFSLLGDPAQRLAYPEHDVSTLTVNGLSVTTTIDTLSALELVSVSGKLVNSETGANMTNFNGVIYPTVFDKETTATTLGNDPSSYPAPFKVRKSLVFRGKASVTDGSFQFQFVVPRDIAYNFDFGRFSYYAENETTNANGYSHDFIIGGSSSDVVLDGVGPDVQLYMNDEQFAYGGTTDENPLLLAVVVDSNGINTVGNGIGHDLTAVLDENSGNTINLNDFYQSDMDSYQSGRISYPFSELSEGVHSLKVKVWDVHNNSSEAFTEFVVSESANLALNHVLNYPNPFTTRTSFYFEHNQACNDLAVQVQVFTVSGKLVKTINETVHNDGFHGDPIDWNGLDDYGQKIGKGVYVYNLKVSTPDGQVAEQLEKLVILN
ncbi:MAG: hypothetical protein ACI85F_000117 [Bacteroidia bacterium]|jgi:hypothetical protein